MFVIHQHGESIQCGSKSLCPLNIQRNLVWKFSTSKTNWAIWKDLNSGVAFLVMSLQVFQNSIKPRNYKIHGMWYLQPTVHTRGLYWSDAPKTLGSSTLKFRAWIPDTYMFHSSFVNSNWLGGQNDSWIEIGNKAWVNPRPRLEVQWESSEEAIDIKRQKRKGLDSMTAHKELIESSWKRDTFILEVPFLWPFTFFVPLWGLIDVDEFKCCTAKLKGTQLIT